MPQPLLAKDIMLPLEEYATVYEEESVRQAIYTLRTSIRKDKTGAYHGHRALLVLNDQGRVSGLLTLLDLLKAVELNNHFNDPWLKASSWSWYFINNIHQSEGTKVKEIMRPLHLVTVKTDQSLPEVIKKMALQAESLVPVLDNNVPVGVIRTVDLFWVLGNLL